MIGVEQVVLVGACWESSTLVFKRYNNVEQ